ncbi:right-handed parallel beta-helix repeat-containing protein [Candidatus Bathyarchaeota archaeon]|nr:right-handed parallel beta-helix repeat-containing protein [Candidatus Bathyarchaeota archaeon]
MKKIVLSVFVLMLLSTTVVVGIVRPVIAQGPIFIQSDGSVDPSTAPIQHIENIYTFTANIYDSILIERDNIVVDGAGYTLRGTGSGVGINVTGSNVTIKNMQIMHFVSGIYLFVSSNNTISGNSITNNGDGITVVSPNNTITGNYITANNKGIGINYVSNNTIIGNTIANNEVGIWFWTYMDRNLDNIIYHNNFINNAKQVDQGQEDPYWSILVNIWDNGKEGNYWSDYMGKDANGDGIGDATYVINASTPDLYPLMNPVAFPEVPDTMPPTVFIVSPENKTYAVSNVSLAFTVSEPTSWICYSLDGQANVTIAGNTILTGLSDGMHSLTVYANDSFGNTGFSGMVHFAIDTSLPSVSILSPENKTYWQTDIPLTFTANEPLSWIAYSLEGQDNVTIAGNVTLAVLSEGSHSLVVYATDTVGNTGASETIYFSIEPSPIIWIVAAIAIIVIVGAALLIYFTKVKKTTKKAE